MSKIISSEQPDFSVFITRLRELWNPHILVEGKRDFTHSTLRIAEILRAEGWRKKDGGEEVKNVIIGIIHRITDKEEAAGIPEEERSFLRRPSPLKRKPRPRQPDFAIVARPTCAWPIGHPGEKDFRHCGAEIVKGKPYCVEHCGDAYIKPKTPAEFRKDHDKDRSRHVERQLARNW
jgi:GcrA cell cycle regulator